MIANNGYLERLHSMLYDTDASVVINAIYVIEELQISTGGLEVTQPLLMALLNRIGEFSEWGLNTILGLISKYRPANEEETYAIMNLLDPVLRTANSGAVLATFKCFTALTAQMPELQPQIYMRGAIKLFASFRIFPHHLSVLCCKFRCLGCVFSLFFTCFPIVFSFLQPNHRCSRS